MNGDEMRKTVLAVNDANILEKGGTLKEEQILFGHVTDGHQPTKQTNNKLFGF